MIMAKQKSPQRREKKKRKKEACVEHNQSRYWEPEYDPPNKEPILTDDFITSIVNKNAMYMYGVGSRLHFALRTFPKHEFRRIWNKQQGRCAISGIQLYGLPGTGPGGIGIDIINHKRDTTHQNNIRIVSSYLAYTRHVKKIRRFNIRFNLDEPYTEEYPVFTAIWEHIYRELKKRRNFFKFMPVTANIKKMPHQINWHAGVSNPTSSRLVFTWHANHDFCPRTDTTVQSHDFCSFSLEDDCLVEAWGNTRWLLADPHVDLVEVIAASAESKFKTTLRNVLGRKR